MQKLSKNISLKTIYLGALTVAFVVTFALFAIFDTHSQQQQSMDALREEAHIFALEMDAVWQFMDNAQYTINYTSDGDYEFKGLHCAVVGKSVGTIFSKDNDYAIRYTNFNPRNYQGEPDAYEKEALTAFNENKELTEYYGIAEYDGVERFRYVQALEVDESCLECHGVPVGEIDITGHEKEGWTLDSVGGAISIVIPIDQQKMNVKNNVIRDVAYFLMLTMLIGGVIYVITVVFVTRPLDRMKLAFGWMQEGSLDIALDDVQSTKEISHLITRFNEMAERLREVYSSLEDEVADRTIDLQEANTILKHQRSNLEQLNKKLEKEMSFKTDLLSMVNHELRTPLTSILTFTQIVCERREMDGETERRSWEEIEKNSRILLGMINNMLDIARSDAGSMKATCELIDLGDIVASLRNTIAPLSKKYEVSFEANIAPDVPLVNGDYEKTLRMLENLASNAIKFTPDGGEIHLIVERNDETDGVRIIMKDTGIGIATEDKERIFERFVQVDSTSTRKYNGSGLGLALVREYANLQGFTVSVDSELGKGSSFVINIPRNAVIGDDDV